VPEAGRNAWRDPGPCHCVNALTTHWLICNRAFRWTRILNAPTEGLGLAILHFEQEQYQRSNEVFFNLDSERHDQSFIRFCVGRNYFLCSNLSEARIWFERSLQITPAFRWTHYELSRLLDILGDVSGACVQMAAFARSSLEQSTIFELNETHVKEMVRVAHRAFEQDRELTIYLYRLICDIGVRDYLSELRVIEYQLDGKRLTEAVTSIGRLTDLHTLDAWGLLVLSRIQFAQGNSSLASATIVMALETDTSSHSIKIAATHALLSFRLLDEAHSYYTYVLRGLIGHDISLDEEIYGVRFRLGVMRRDHDWLIVNCRAVGFLERIPNWLCVEGLFNFSLPGVLSTPPDLEVANELQAFLETQQPYTIGTILSLLQSYSHGRLWDKVAQLEAEIESDPLFEHHEVVLRRFECLCSALRMGEAEDFYYKYYSEKQLRHWEACVVLRFLAEAKMWLQAEKLLLYFFDSYYYLPDGNFFILKLCRRFSNHSEVIRKIDASSTSKKPVQYDQLRTLLIDDLIIKSGSRSSYVDTTYHAAELSYQNALFHKLPAQKAHRYPSIAGYLCADKAYFFPALTFFASVATHKSEDTKPEWFLFLDSDVPDGWISIGGNFAKKIGLKIKIVRESEFAQGRIANTESYGIFTGGNTLSSAAFLRIYAAKYLYILGKFERAIYFDSDIVCNQDLLPLVSLPFDAALVLARREEVSPEIQRVTDQHCLAPMTYFNSGVLVFNLAAHNIEAHISEAIWISEHKASCLIFHDQCALNIAFANTVKFLDPRINFFIRSNRPDNGDTSSALLLHFLDQPKPWSLAYERGCRAIWWRYAGIVRMLLSSPDYNAIVAASN